MQDGSKYYVWQLMHTLYKACFNVIGIIHWNNGIHLKHGLYYVYNII